VFAGNAGEKAEPDAGDAAGFKVFMEHYTEVLAIEKAAVEHLK
jgi:hypothetical protein